MKAYIQDGKVVGIYGTEQHAPKDMETVDLAGIKPVPQLGWLYKNGKFSEPPRVIPKVTLDQLKDAALYVIDTEAVVVRQAHIGTLDFQLAIYTAKFQDAKAFQLKIFGDDVSNYKWIEAEVSATGKTAVEAATNIIALHSAMLDTLAKVEELRIYGKSAVRDAKDAKEVQEVKMQAVSELRKL